METLGFGPETFKQLPKDGARFEALVCQLLEAMGYRILDKPAVGTDGGCDILIERTTGDAITQRRERVCVQCKHKAHSGKSVGDSDLGVWRNAMTRHQTQGYLLVTDVRVTENVSRSFQKFTDNNSHPNEWAAFWDVDELIKHLNAHPDVRDSFFPPLAVKQTPLEELAVEVRIWLQAIRYKVDDPQPIDDRSIDLVALLQEGTIKQRVMVRCIGGEILPSDVQALQQKLDMDTPDGWIISDMRVASEVRSGTKATNVEVFSLSQFLKEKAWGPYIDALTSLVETERIPELYVDIEAESDTHTFREPSIPEFHV